MGAVAFAADLHYPYLNIRLKLPPSEDPFPGLGNYYSTLSRGIKSALWNPASLGKLELTEASLSSMLEQKSYNYERSFDVAEYGGDLDLGDGGTSGGRYGIFFRYPDDIGSGLATREIEVMGHANYATESTGLNFSTALKVNEWITVGFATTNPLEVSGDLSGEIPVTAKTITSFYGQTFGDMVIGNDGKLEYTFTDGGGGVTTFESTGSVWQGFLSQEATVPLIALTEARNSLNIESPFIGTVSSRYKNLYVGLNMIPINATAQINNDVRAVVSSDTGDVFLYTPDFDPDNETDLTNWINDPDNYGTSAGYKRKQIKLPAGQTIGTAKYRGFYTASAARFDLGAMYDITDWLTVGIVLENMGGASLDFTGTGRAAYYSYRNIDTAEADNFDDLIQPGGPDSIDLITDTWVTSHEVQGRKLYLEPQKNYALPQRLRYGFALKKPFLIAIDFEQNSTPMTFTYTDNDLPQEVTISNISLMRIGTETQFFALPFWLRSGLTLLSKPTVTGLDADAQQSFDDAFQFGFLPLKFDMGADINLWGTLVGGSFGFNGQSVFSFVQLDTTNLDLTKFVFYNTYVARDAWQIDYRAQVDPSATAAAYGTKITPAGEEKGFEFSDVKFVQTLGVTYRF
ncbi:hypothetical protein ACFL1W_00655 [Candidatus Margulisiibacteriota bacterium]